MTLRSPLLLLGHMPYSGNLPSAMRTIRGASRRDRRDRRDRRASPILFLLMRRLHRSVRQGMRSRTWRGRSRCTHQTGIATVGSRLRPQHRTRVSMSSSWSIIQHQLGRHAQVVRSEARWWWWWCRVSRCVLRPGWCFRSIASQPLPWLIHSHHFSCLLSICLLHIIRWPNLMRHTTNASAANGSA
jgi:hypothetical protein